MITATSLLCAQAELPVYVGLYLLPLRHPVPFARQLATIAQLTPGRLTLGDGWLGIWASPRRFATVRDQIAREATQAGRDVCGFEHALNVWCSFAPTRESARERLAAQMQAFYQMPFEPCERYSPYGTVRAR